MPITRLLMILLMEIVLNNLKLLILILCVCILGCTNSEDNLVENNKPSSFDITITSISENNAVITWTKSIDPEGEVVFYDVFLESKKKIDNITELTYEFTSLEENTPYNGNVVASDALGNTVSESFIFETSINQPPTPFTVSIKSTSPYSSKIEWTNSTDPEGGPIYYDVFFENNKLDTNSNNLYYDFKELKGLKTYTGYVEAIDRSGKKTTSQFSFTTDRKIYSGTLILDSQDSIEDFGKIGYNDIQGNLIIGSLSRLTDVNNLSHLVDLRAVEGSIYVSRTNCKTLQGLEQLEITHQNGSLIIDNNQELINLIGLNNITKAHRVYISGNDKLENLDGLNKLKTIHTDLSIVANPLLNSLAHLSNIYIVNNQVDVGNNPSLKNLKGLENINTTLQLNINNNLGLISLEGLENFQSASSVSIADNEVLTDLQNLKKFKSVGSITISRNNSLINLKGLENLTSVRSKIAVVFNPNLETLQGIENIIFDKNSNYSEFILWDSPKITNLNPLSNYTFRRGKIKIDNNKNLIDFCGLKKLFNNVSDLINDYNFATRNGYNPNFEDVKNGNCSI